MNFFRVVMTWVLFLFPLNTFCQESLTDQESGIQKIKQINGFIRGGLYTGTDHDNKYRLYVSSAFADFDLKADIENGINFKAFADLRFRYGAEFLKPVSLIDIREAFVNMYGKKWDISAGQKIVKWGRADFTNPTSRLSPQNFISRSPDREDMDMGNLLADLKWYPFKSIGLEVVAVPYYRPSTLIIEPVKLPENVKINQINTLITGRKNFSYGVKADFHLKGIDWGMYWFDGYDPIPGIALTSFNLDLSGTFPVAATELTLMPYKTRVSGIDFETSAGAFGIRGETALSSPYLSYNTYEYIPRPEIKWVAGTDWSSGNWRITGEYSGKYVTHFTKAAVEPIIGTEPDYAMLSQLLGTPGFDLEGYVRKQTGAFNRLYNYQMEKYYHSGAIRIEVDLAYGKLTPSVFTMYNFTSGDVLFIPEIKYKPADGLTITTGAEIYNGRKGSLYDIIDGFMNSMYVSLKADF
jgi:hypothetical protein